MNAEAALGAPPAKTAAGPALVTFIMPLYNKSATLAEAIASVQRQTRAQWRVIVIDDESTDDSLRVARELARADERITVLARPHSGASGARNHGIAAAASEWLMFLDADDWIADNTVELLLETAAEHPEADCIYSGWRTFPATGKPFSNKYALDPSERSFFRALSNGCAFPLHAAIVRTELVQALDGFDAGLVTCEDWDLWLRLARAGAVFQSRPGEVAFYRTHAGSQSATGFRMLHDALEVIDRAYAPDPRVSSPTALDAPGAPRERRSSVRVVHTIYAAGLILGHGVVPDEVFELLREDRATLITMTDSVAFQLHSAIPRATGTGAEDWWVLPNPIRAAVDQFLLGLEQMAETPGLARAIRRSLEDQIFTEAVPPQIEPQDLGFSHVRQIDLAAPLQGCELPAGVDRLRCLVRWKQHPLVAVTIPAADGSVAPDILLDACLAPNVWKVLGLVFEGCADAPEDFAVAFVERGWEMFLRALWGQPDWSHERFYDALAADDPGTEEITVVPGTRPVVDILKAVPVLVSNETGPIEIEVRLAEEPLWQLSVEAPQGRATAQAIRVAVNSLGGLELCRAVLRRWLTSSAPPGASLRDALLASPLPALTDGEARIGMRRGGVVGTAASRRALLPAAARAQVLEDARIHDEPVVDGDADGAAVRYDPGLSAGASASSALRAHGDGQGPIDSDGNRHYFEALYASAEDPWGYTSPYEALKYEQTLALVPDGTSRALELACAGGHFTAQLASRVGQVDALDVSELALERAIARCAGIDNVTFRRANLFAAAQLGSDYDVAICSEVLYYADNAEQVATAVDNIARALRPGGMLIAAHHHVLVDDPSSSGMNWPLRFGARSIERIILASRRFTLQDDLYNGLYRVQRYRVEARRRLPRLRAPQVPHRELMPAADTLPAAVRISYRPDGGEPADPHALEWDLASLPLLMYHRVADSGAPQTRRYRVTPDELEAQLSYLSSAGYRSATLDEWATATLTRAPLTGKRVALTFDDGYTDFEENALPLLEKYGFHATMFVVTDHVGGVNHWDRDLETLPLMDWNAIRRIAARGITIGGHTATHPRLATLDDAGVVRELARCRTALKRELGDGARCFASPYGSRDVGIDELVGACGFEIAVTCEPRSARPWDPLTRLPRHEVFGEMGLDGFIRLLTPNPDD